MLAGDELGAFEYSDVPGGSYESSQLPQPEGERVLLVVQLGTPLSFGDDLLDSLYGGMRDVSVELDLLSHELCVSSTVAGRVGHGDVHKDLVTVSDYPRPKR